MICIVLLIHIIDEKLCSGVKICSTLCTAAKDCKAEMFIKNVCKNFLNKNDLSNKRTFDPHHEGVNNGHYKNKRTFFMNSVSGLEHLSTFSFRTEISGTVLE